MANIEFTLKPVAKKEVAKKEVAKKAVKKVKDNIEKSTLGDISALSNLKSEMEKSEKKKKGE